MTLSAEDLHRIMPRLSAAGVAVFHPAALAAAAEFEILDEPRRLAAFLAQLAHESGEFRWMVELWGPTAAQKRYEPPGKKAVELGNVRRGDGYLYRGRGPIQLTGRGNYRRAGQALGLDLEGDPDLVATPTVGCRVAGWFWRDEKKLNPVADREDFRRITKRINGGLNGFAERVMYYQRARSILGLPPWREMAS